MKCFEHEKHDVLAGIFQCGPASVLAVKQGDVNLNYDTAFVFTEVNADINRWVVYPDGRKVRVYCDTSSIGTAISTKAVGSNHRVDITNNYKFPEGKRLPIPLGVIVAGPLVGAQRTRIRKAERLGCSCDPPASMQLLLQIPAFTFNCSYPARAALVPASPGTGWPRARKEFSENWQEVGGDV